MKNTYFYARVSALDQNLDRQLIAADGRGVPHANVFTEKLSGKDTKRPELQRLIATVQPGDTIIPNSRRHFNLRGKKESNTLSINKYSS